MRTAAIVVLAAVLAGCVGAVKVESGERRVGERLVFQLEGAWNQISAPGIGPAQVWTMEGLPIDQLLVYSGIKDGEEMSANTVTGGAQGKAKTFTFRSSMQPDELVALFEGMFTRDGSTFKLERLEPAAFGGGKGFRFEYSMVRKADNARLAGLGYGTVSRGELFALVYLAPRLTFFPRHKARVEGMARAASVK